MKIEDMNLSEVTTRLAELDEEVRKTESIETVEAATKEKTELLARKAELEDLEQRKATALAISQQVVPFSKIDVRKESKNMEFEKMTIEEVRSTETYRDAWVKRLQDKPLNEYEKRANEMGSGDVTVIPTITQGKIIDKMTQYAPLLGEIDLLRVPGNVTYGVEGTENDAILHTQNAAITPAADVMTYVSLSGFEIVKLIRISATVKKMSIPAFETWIVNKIAKKLAKKIGSYIIYGTGSNQPKGIDYMATWVDGTNAVDWASTAPTAAELVEQVSYLGGGYYNGAKWLMNSKTFWGRVVSIQDNSKFKLLTDDYKRLLGCEVLLDDNVADDDIFFGNFEMIVGNLVEDMNVTASEHSAFIYNGVDYRGTCIFDCTPAVTDCFVKSAPTLTAGA